MGSKIAAISLAPNQHQIPAVGKLNAENWWKKKELWQGHATSWSEKQRSQPLRFKNQMAVKPAMYSSRIFTDIPLYESPGEKQAKQFLEQCFLKNKEASGSIRPVVDMRLSCKTGGKDYPSDVPRDITKVLELDISRWEVRGLDNDIQPSNFSLGVKGALYSDRRRTRSRLKGHLEMNISFVRPPVLALIPDDVLQNVTKTVLTRLVEDMKHKVNGSLLANYSEFKREAPK